MDATLANVYLIFICIILMLYFVISIYLHLSPMEEMFYEQFTFKMYLKVLVASVIYYILLYVWYTPVLNFSKTLFGFFKNHTS